MALADIDLNALLEGIISNIAMPKRVQTDAADVEMQSLSSQIDAYERVTALLATAQSPNVRPKIKFSQIVPGGTVLNY